MAEKRKKIRSGVGLVEAMVASSLVVLAALQSISTFMASEKTISNAEHELEATSYSQATLEELTAKGFNHPDLTATADHPQELPLGKLKDTFQGSRTYTIEDIKDEETQQTVYKKITARTIWYTSEGKDGHEKVLVTLLSTPDDYHNPNILPPEVWLDAVPKIINRGEKSRLSWNSKYAVTLTIEGRGSVAVPSGNLDVYPEVTTEYKITACNVANVCVDDKETIIVNNCTPNCSGKVCGDDGCSGSCGPSCPEGQTCQDGQCVIGEGENDITVTLVASPEAINIGGTPTLYWTSTNAKTATINWQATDGTSGILGSVSPVEGGSIPVGPLQVTTTYTITACNDVGECRSAAAIVTVGESVPEVHLFAIPSIINKGDPSTLRWTSNNADTLKIDQGIGEVGKIGHTSVLPQIDTTYTITACNDAGVCVTDSVKIKVICVPDCESAGKDCGDDGCGGTCGACDTNLCLECRNFICKSKCKVGETCDKGICRPSSHKECSGGQCITVSGVGDNTCTDSANCKYKDCDFEPTSPTYRKCITLNAPGKEPVPSNCEDDFHCEASCPERIGRCWFNLLGPGSKCIFSSRPLEPGEVPCAVDSGCTQKHYECSAGKCIVLDGVGNDTCYPGNEGSDCPTHKGCFRGRCTKVLDGAGPDECTVNTASEDCYSMICDGGQCLLEDIPGPDTCTDCTGKQCGTDSCGKSCGTCNSANCKICSNGQCVSTCSSANCETCSGGQCVSKCSSGQCCKYGSCISQNCGTKKCGTDTNCNMSCGTCGANERCNSSGQCEID
jgi:hypothetical protein